MQFLLPSTGSFGEAGNNEFYLLTKDRAGHTEKISISMPRKKIWRTNKN
jgi:hypothetical protein